MKEKPIIFNGEMVRAILDGRKSQTRRVVKPQPEYGSDTAKLFPGVSVGGNDWRFGASGICTNKVDWFDRWFKCPYGNPGDRLWVRETFGICPDYNDVRYRASERVPEGLVERWKPSIHMPRKYARIPLEVLDVRVERVKEITHQDAWSEGIDLPAYAPVLDTKYPSPREKFQELWDSINAKRGYGWDSNPWVWVVTFKRLEA